MSLRREISGVLPVVQTPYREDESIDVATLKREIDWLYELGVDGVTVAMVSEILRLATDEREQLAEDVCRINDRRGAVVISVGAESHAVTGRLVHHARRVGADALMAIPPVSTALGEDQLVEYYRRIIEATDLPVIVQDASGYVGRPMPIAAQAALLETFGEQRVMFKPEATPIGPRLSELHQATGGRARVFEGSGGIALLDSYSRRIVGTMPGADLAPAIVPLWKALVTGDDERAEKIWLPLAALVSMQQGLDGFLAVEKHLLLRQGVFVNQIVRGPVSFVLDDLTRKRVDELFDSLLAEVGRVLSSPGRAVQ